MKKITTTFIIAVTMIASGFGSWSCQRGYSGPVDSIMLGAQLLEGAVPIFIAQNEGFFTQNGLNVTVKGYETGMNALNGMLKGEVDVAATVSEYVVVGKIFDNQPVEILGSLEKIDCMSILARKDQGIGSASDLRGKKIGIIPKSNLEFFLGRFLELHGMNIKDVNLVDVGTLPQSVDAVVSGKVDAIVSLPPYDKQVQVQLGSNVTIFPAQGGQFIYTLLVSNSEWLKTHSNMAERFLKAIEQAEQDMIQHPTEAKAIAKTKLNVTDDEITRIWSQNQYSLSLDQALIVAMEDQARWMIKNNLTVEKEVPDFTKYVYVDTLKAVKPGAVNIIK